MTETNQQLTQQFYAHFQATHSDLASRVDALTANGARPDVLQQLSVDFAKLRKELTDATNFLPSYDQRQCEIRLKAVEESLQTLRAAAAPKSKFAFKRKASKTVNSVSPTSSTQGPPPVEEHAVIQPNILHASTGVTLSGHSHKLLDLSSLPSPTTDLTLSDLDHCVVYMLPYATSGDDADGEKPVTITALHVRNVRDSVLVLPRIEGSALLHDMSRCLLALGCHQYRMHASTNTDVYIAVASNPIIEYCKGIRFAQYPATFGLVGEELPSKLSVQDFSHIRATPSPNWCAIPDDKVPPQESWPRPTHGENLDVDGILRRLLPEDVRDAQK